MRRDDGKRDARAELFEEVVLVLGGVFAVRGTDDATVRQVAAGLEQVWWQEERGESTLAAIIAKLKAAPGVRPHPAIVALLRLVDGRAGPLPQARPGEGGEPDLDPEEEEDDDEDEFMRVPGLFRRWEIERVLEAGADYHLEDAGTTADGGQLYAVFRREAAPPGEVVGADG
ncbi:MAG: hypothetical protein WC683_01990 [bacterium]